MSHSYRCIRCEFISRLPDTDEEYFELANDIDALTVHLEECDGAKFRRVEAA